MVDESAQSSYPLTYAVMRSLDRWRDFSTIEALIKEGGLPVINGEEYSCIQAIVDHIALVLSDVSDDRRRLYGIRRSNNFMPNAWLVFRGLFMTGRIPRGIKIKGLHDVVRARLAIQSLLTKVLAHVHHQGLPGRCRYELLIPVNFMPVYIKSEPLPGWPHISMLEPVRKAEYFDFRGRSLEQVERDLQRVYEEILEFVIKREGFGNFDGAVARAYLEL